MFLMMYTSQTTPMTLLILTTIMSSTSKQWTILWLMMEISTISFILIMLSEKMKEKLIMYFLFQSMPSLTLMVFMFMLNWSMEQNNNKYTHYMVLFAIMMKIGLFPLHTWVVKFNKNLKWINLTILLTWQKFIPILMLMKSSLNTTSKWMAINSMMMLTMIMMKMTNLKVVMTLSSTIHNSWMMIPMKFYKSMSSLYLIMYSMILPMVNMFLFKNNSKLMYKQMMEKNFLMNILLKMFSLAGIPPMIGFMLKMVVLYCLMKLSNQEWTMFILFMASSINFYVYSQMFYKNLSLMKTNTLKMNKNQKNKNTTMFWLSAMTPMMFFY